MDQFLKELTAVKDLTGSFTMIEVILAIFISLISAVIISQVYKITHKGISYSQSFTQTLVIVEITVAVIMLVVGSNIARAFSLVGALSIVRFRTAVKDSRDIAFIFFAMVAGMAFGTKFYLLGLVFTAALSVIIYIMYVLNYGAKGTEDKILKIAMPEEISDKEIENVLNTYFKEFYLASRDAVGDGLAEVVYIVKQRKKINEKAVISKLQEVNGGRKVTIVEGRHEIDL